MNITETAEITSMGKELVLWNYLFEQINMPSPATRCSDQLNEKQPRCMNCYLACLQFAGEHADVHLLEASG